MSTAGTALKIVRAFFAGVLTYFIALSVGTLILTIFGFQLADPDKLAYAIGLRMLCMVMAGYVSAWVLGTKEVLIALVVGLIPTVPALLFASSESFVIDAAELLLNSGTGALGGAIRFGLTHRWHHNLLVRAIVGGSLTVIGYVLMIVMALGQLVYMAPLLSHSRTPGPLSFPQLLGLIALGGAGLLIAYTGRRIARIPGQQVVAQAKGNYVLYLRAFSDDDLQLKEDEAKTKPSILESNAPFGMLLGGFKMIGEATKDSSFEGQLTKLLQERLAPVVALMKPGETLPPVAGAARLEIGSDVWQVEIKALMQDCRLILMIMGTGASLFWELDQVLQVAPQKILVAIPPVKVDVTAERLRALRTVFSAHGIVVPELVGEAKFLYVNEGVACFATGTSEGRAGYREALWSIPLFGTKASGEPSKPNALVQKG